MTSPAWICVGAIMFSSIFVINTVVVSVDTDLTIRLLSWSGSVANGALKAYR